MKISDRHIAITDFETSGLNPLTQEILEIGMVLVNQKTLQIMDALDMKVYLEYPEWADINALKYNGYDPIVWMVYGKELSEAMAIYSQKTKDAIFCSYNMMFDWPFLEKAFKKTGVKNLLYCNPLDLLTMSWLKLRNSGLEKYKMDEVAKHLGVPEEPMPHRALNGAMTAYEIYKRLVS